MSNYGKDLRAKAIRTSVRGSFASIHSLIDVCICESVASAVYREAYRTVYWSIGHEARNIVQAAVVEAVGEARHD
jgi:bacteriorhodopsin